MPKEKKKRLLRKKILVKKAKMRSVSQNMKVTNIYLTYRKERGQKKKFGQNVCQESM